MSRRPANCWVYHNTVSATTKPLVAEQRNNDANVQTTSPPYLISCPRTPLSFNKPTTSQSQNHSETSNKTAVMGIEFNPQTTDQVLTNAWEIASTSFVETSYFLLAGLVVLTIGMLVGYILVKSLDRNQDPFVVFRLDSIKPVPLLTSALVFFFCIVQVVGVTWKVFTSEGPVSLADTSLVTAAATVGAEAACLVIFWLTGVFLAFVGAASEVSDDATVRSRSRANKRTAE
ncbi:hypothetical protein LTR97_011549 [Elasticomyces elasticus]|uniref:Uncharacterized protein n=1 Tax=Elasticomyces elasticus TaxID=574655 RepID=A0AAN7W240_9PEZI|nr:hypothetical protein LTR97_011549 [Elasticomyces elasticus]